MMKKSQRSGHAGRGLDIEEVRLVSDLRIMHSKVNELYEIIRALQRRHNETDIHKYADAILLASDISRVDDIYLWFVKLKESQQRQTG